MRKKILIIDDDPGIRDIFGIIFENAGYLVELKENGADIFNGHFTMPHLFLIDKQLSGASGLDICRYLKSREDTRDIPALLISASPDLASHCLLAGADGFIEKPFDLNHLLAVVEGHLHRSAKTVKASTK